MHPTAMENGIKFVNNYVKDGMTVLDVGSYDVNGNLRNIFTERNCIYTGLDMCKGKNVDVVSSSHNIPFENESFDIIISTSCFEHDSMFWMTFREMARVVKKGGYIYINAPSAGPYHGYPGDCWRFYKDSWKSLELFALMQIENKSYNIKLVETYIDERPPWKDSVGIFTKIKD